MLAILALGAAPPPPFRTDVPDHTFDVILGRLEKTSVVASVLAYEDLDGYIEYGTAPGEYRSRTTRVRFHAGVPLELAVEPLTADTRYYYRLRYRTPGDTAPFWTGDEATFRTQRGPGTAFRFTVQADSKLDRTVNPELYARALGNAALERPDFHVDLGNAFMTAARGKNFKDALPQYLAQRYYFGSVCRSAGLFLAPGALDGESGARSTPAMAEWAREQRRRYFPGPAASASAGGATYYSWEWGDGVFAVLDAAAGGQAQWLEKTLEESGASLRFVFVHRRPGADIGRILARHSGVVVFYGAERSFAKEEVEGVVYQGVPSPGGAAPGHFVVRVSRDEARVEFIGAVLSGAESRGRRNAAVVTMYRVKGRVEKGRQPK